MMLRMKFSFLVIVFLTTFSSLAANLADINVSNGDSQATVTLSFNGQPVYGFFPLHHPDRVVLDIRQSGVVKGLPLNFSGDNIVKRIRSSQPKDSQSIRLVFELTQPAKTRAVTQRNGNNYKVIFTISGRLPVKLRSSDTDISSVSRSAPSSPAGNPFKANPVTAVTSDDRVVASGRTSGSANDVVIVAIDAGHGGQDPGAIGAGGLKEKKCHHCYCPQAKGAT